MKISSKQYAKALYELTKDKNEREIDSVVLNFSKELKKQRKLKTVDDIINKFSDIYNRKNGIVEVEVISTREIEEEQIKEVNGFVKERYGAKEVILDKKIDEEIKGGIILKIGDEIIDGSISKKLKNLGVLLKK